MGFYNILLYKETRKGAVWMVCQMFFDSIILLL